MCWVMPPASPAATLDLRMTSSSVVLPWSTWPMIVTTGGRGLSCSILSSTSSSTFLAGAWTTPPPRSRFSTSKRKPYLAQTCWAIFSSIAWLTLANTPSSIKPPIVVRDLAEQLKQKPFKVIADLMELGVFANVNQPIEESIAQRICAKYGFRFEAEKRERGSGLVH